MLKFIDVLRFAKDIKADIKKNELVSKKTFVNIL